MRFRRSMLFTSWRSAAPFAGLGLAFAGLAAGVGLSACTDAGAGEIARGMEMTDLVAYWGVRGQDAEGNNYIRPAVRFRLTNRNSEPVQYVQVMSVFRRESAPEEAWGTGYLHSVSETALAPGEATAEHTLRADSNYLSKGSPQRMFDNALWEDVEVEMFVRVGASTWVSQGKTVALRRLGPPGVEKYLEPIDEEPIYGHRPSKADPEGSPESDSRK